jgi:hypothetical protein
VLPAKYALLISAQAAFIPYVILNVIIADRKAVPIITMTSVVRTKGVNEGFVGSTEEERIEEKHEHANGSK